MNHKYCSGNVCKLIYIYLYFLQALDFGLLEFVFTQTLFCVILIIITYKDTSNNTTQTTKSISVHSCFK